MLVTTASTQQLSILVSHTTMEKRVNSDELRLHQGGEKPLCTEKQELSDREENCLILLQLTRRF